MKQKTKQPDTCVFCGSMSLRLLKDRATSDPILSPEGMKIYRCGRCCSMSNEYTVDIKVDELETK
jgi:predicted RNA-binding Zn-ribbon protein involved in translation (DUF1610 family)